MSVDIPATKFTYGVSVSVGKAGVIAFVTHGLDDQPTGKGEFWAFSFKRRGGRRFLHGANY